MSHQHHSQVQGRDIFPFSEDVEVPTELHEFAKSGPKITPILLKVKETSGVGTIAISKDDSSVHITSSTKESLQTAKLLLTINFREQIKLQKDIQRVVHHEELLSSVQGEIASGQHITFKVNVDLIGSMIGSKGVRVKEIQKNTGVSSIYVNGESGEVTIVGPTAASVQEARELLELVEDTVPLTENQVNWYAQDRSYLQDVKSMSGCIASRLGKGTDILLIGTRSAVSNAKLVIKTQLEYLNKRIEINQSTDALRSQIREIKKDGRMNFRSQDDSYDGRRQPRSRRPNDGNVPVDSLQQLNQRRNSDHQSDRLRRHDQNEEPKASQSKPRNSKSKQDSVTVVVQKAEHASSNGLTLDAHFENLAISEPTNKSSKGKRRQKSNQDANADARNDAKPDNQNEAKPANESQPAPAPKPKAKPTPRKNADGQESKSVEEPKKVEITVAPASKEAVAEIIKSNGNDPLQKREKKDRGQGKSTKENGNGRGPTLRDALNK